jgi:hypothetical protein
MRDRLKEAVETLGDGGAARRAARLIIDFLRVNENVGTSDKYMNKPAD